MDIFSLWHPSLYTFLVIESTADGNVVVDEYETNGIVKLRDAMDLEPNMEFRQSASTIHVRPDESFLAVVGGNMIGHGIRVGKDNEVPREFRIINQTKGDDMRGQHAFYRITLRPEVLSYGESS